VLFHVFGRVLRTFWTRKVGADTLNILDYVILYFGEIFRNCFVCQRMK
jgi:hypothetical protein